LGNADTILLGRNTYQGIAPYWSAQLANLLHSAREDADFADMMNSYEKVVFSKTLKSVSWRNSRLAGRSISKEIKELKKAEGKTCWFMAAVNWLAALTKVKCCR
jgi:dihydrofolate reductase